MSVKHRIKDELLRTLASVPPGQSIIAYAPADVAEDLVRLGLDVRDASPTNALSDSRCHWGLVLLEQSSWVDAVGSAISLADKVRDGGWIFVGILDAMDPPLSERAAAVLERMILGRGLTLAQNVSIWESSSMTSIYAIIRRVSSVTPA